MSAAWRSCFMSWSQVSVGLPRGLNQNTMISSVIWSLTIAPMQPIGVAPKQEKLSFNLVEKLIRNCRFYSCLINHFYWNFFTCVHDSRYSRINPFTLYWDKKIAFKTHYMLNYKRISNIPISWSFTQRTSWVEITISIFEQTNYKEM